MERSERADDLLMRIWRSAAGSAIPDDLADEVNEHLSASVDPAMTPEARNDREAAIHDPAPSTVEMRAVLLTEEESRVAGISHLWYMTEPESAPSTSTRADEERAIEPCPTCGTRLYVNTSDEGTSSFGEPAPTNAVAELVEAADELAEHVGQVPASQLTVGLPSALARYRTTRAAFPNPQEER